MFTVEELLKATKGRLIRGKKDTRVAGLSIDSRTLKRQEAFLAIKGSNFNGHDFISAAIKKGSPCIIKQADEKKAVGKSVALIEVGDTQKALGELACFWRNKFNIPVIALTGSNGKTTVKEMIARVLSAQYSVLKNEGTKNNQLGLPLTLLKLEPKHNLAVLELGTNHPGEIEYLAKICQPNIGIITNIGPAHLEYLKNLAGVLKEKYALIDNLNRPRLAILNADDALLKTKIKQKRNREIIFTYGMKNQSEFFASGISLKRGSLKFKLNNKYKFELKTPACHNISNALAAIAVGRLFGMSYSKIKQALSNFEFIPGRLKIITLNQVKFIDDTYNSNPFSFTQALEVLDSFRNSGRKILVMGDMLELGSQKEKFHRQAGYQVAGACDVLVAVGRLSRLSAESARGAGLGAKMIFTCDSSSEAREVLFNRISPDKDDVVLVKGSRLMKMEEVLK